MPSKKTKKKDSESFIISQYFGFTDIALPQVNKDDVLAAEKLRKYDSDFLDANLPPVEEHVAHMRMANTKKMLEKPLPLFHYFEGNPRGPHKKRRSKKDENHVHLHIVGSPKSISESILIKTAITILEAHGHKDVHVSICNIGDEDVQKVFNKELTSYLRTHVNDMNATCRELFKKGSHSLISCNALSKDILAETPDPVNFLSDSHCSHLGEVVNFLESHEIPYEINKNILGNPHYSTDTVFTIIDEKTGEIVATGTRYNHLARKLGYRKDVPSSSIHIKLPAKNKPKKKQVPYAEPKFYLIHIGQEAKTKSLKVIDALRKIGISVYQSLGRDKLSTQMQIAQKKNFTHLIIMGHKEAIEDGVIVRNMYNHEQDFVPINELPAYLKKIK